MTAKRASMGVFNGGHDSFFESCDINNALDGTKDSMKMIWFGMTTKKKKKQKMKKSRLTTSSRQTAQPRMTSS